MQPLILPGTGWRRAAGLGMLICSAALGAWKLPLERLPEWVDRLGSAAPVISVAVVRCC